MSAEIVVWRKREIVPMVDFEGTGFSGVNISPIIAAEKPVRFVGRPDLGPVDLRGYRGDSAR